MCPLSNTLTELAQRFDVHANQIAEWRRQLVAHAAEAFSEGERREAPIDVKALHAKIGQQALELDFLANALGRAPVRAESDDRPDSPTVGRAAGAAPRALTGRGVLHGPPGASRRYHAHAPHRRAASRAPVRR